MGLKSQHHLDLEALQTFLLVIEEGSLTAAASALYKTPSAVSYRIKALEESLGIQLLERTTHAIAPTTAGKRLAAKAQDLLEFHRGFYDELDAIKTGIEPSFTLVVNNLLYDGVAVAKLLAHLSEKFGSAALNVQKSVFTGVWDYMVHEGGSFAIGAPSHHSIDERFVTTPLGLVEWVLVCSPNHPILRTGIEVDGDSIKQHPVVNIQDTSTHSIGRPAWRLEGQEEIIVPDLETKIHCHVMGLGIGFLPKPIADRWIAAKKLCALSAKDIMRQPSPMSYARKKNDDGRIGNYLEYLIKRNHELIQPFLSPLIGQEAHGQASSR